MNVPNESETSPTPTEQTPAPEATPTEQALNPEPVSQQPVAETVSQEAPAPLTVESIQLPEGVEADQELLSQFVEVGNKHGLTPDAANELLGMYFEQAAAFGEEQTSSFTATLDQWKQEALALPEMAEGQRPETLAGIAKVLDQFGSPELREVLDLTGAGDNPVMLQFFINIAKQFNEPGPQPGGVPDTEAQRSTASRLFGDMFG